MNKILEAEYTSQSGGPTGVSISSMMYFSFCLFIITFRDLGADIL